MKVLLTGASGFIGHHILNQLLKNNIEVVVIGRNCPEMYKGKFINTDLLNLDTMSAVFSTVHATHMIHIAWYAEHGKYWSSSNNLRWVEASIRLAELFCKSGGEHILTAGTCAEYDWKAGYFDEEKSNISPDTLYGITKNVTQKLISAICESYSVSWCWGRIFFPYGSGENTKRLIPSLHSVFQGKCHPFGVNSDSYRDFIHVEDVAGAFVKLSKYSACGIYNISSGEPTRIADLVRHIASIYKKNPDIILQLQTKRMDDATMIVGKNDKLKSLGWYPNFSIV